MKTLALAAASLVLLAGCAAPAHHHARGMRQDGAMEQHMQSMQHMREQLAAAKTPEERQALMQRQMELMHRGMDMLSGMGPGGGEAAGPHAMMEMRMQMMQSMMQMMMDRMDPMHAR